jgi:hypothetical protein
VLAAAAAAAAPAVRSLMSDKGTADGVDWGTLQGRMRAALPAADRRRLQPMFQQVRRLSRCM